jgi:hypothetical protein
MPKPLVVLHALALLFASPLLADDCDRTFQTPVRYGVSGNVRDVITTDFDSDGLPDLVVGVDSPPELALLKNRRMTFELATPVALPEVAERIFAEDKDGDGRIHRGRQDRSRHRRRRQRFDSPR